MADFHVKIISSNRTFYEGVCHCLILPAVDGEMAVMAHHESEIVAVKAGEMRPCESSGAFLFQRKVRPDESGREYFERYLRKETGDG